MRHLNRLYPALLCLTVGCIGPATRPKASQAGNPPVHVVLKNYSREAPKTAVPGEAMLKVKDYWVQNNAVSSFVLDRAVTVQTRKRVLTLPHGALLVCGGPITINGNLYTMYHSGNDDPDYGVIYYFNPDMTMARFLYMRDAASFPTGMEAITKIFPESFKLPNVPAPTIVLDREPRDYEMVFKGLEADGLHLIYREFSPGAETSSFQQELTFPATAGNISYKDIQIKILTCSEKQLLFTVLSE